MQQQLMKHENILEELNEVKAQLSSIEKERDRAINEAKEIKMQVNNAEVNKLKEDLQNAKKELQAKDNAIESLKSEVHKLKQLESKLREEEDSLRNVKDEANNFKSSLTQTENILSDSKKRGDNLAIEMGQLKESEVKLSESFAARTSQIEQSSSLLENSKLQITLLEEKMRDLVKESERKEKEAREERERLNNIILVHKEDANRADERYNEAGSLDTQTLWDEIEILKGELKKAMEAEDASKRAMDDLAVALKEVAAESNETKEKLTLTEQQLQVVEEEAANLKIMWKSKEENYEMLMKDLKKENDQLNNTVNRLRLEAEESVLAFNDREIQFVECIKSTEEEKCSVQEECNRLAKSLREAEETREKPKEEIRKLRDILKQALNEANVAKEAATLAQEENSYLKDFISEKDKALLTLAQETERLRINEAEANESIKELKRALTSGSKKEFARLEREDKEHKKEKEHSKELKKEKEHSRELKKGTITAIAGENSEKEHREDTRLSKRFSFDLNQLWPVNPSKTHDSSKDFDEDLDEDDALEGSIYDVVDSLKELPTYHQKTASACSSEDNLNLDQLGEDTNFDDIGTDKTSQGNRKALLRRFGDLLRRKNPHPQKDLPQPPKEVSPAPKEIPA